MSLSDKLERAKIERLLAAGLINSAAALKPESQTTPVAPPMPAAAWDPITIEALPYGIHAVAEPIASVATQVATIDDRCPNCRRPGQVDLVDLVGHTTHLSCRTCHSMWQLTS